MRTSSANQGRHPRHRQGEIHHPVPRQGVGEVCFAIPDRVARGFGTRFDPVGTETPEPQPPGGIDSRGPDALPREIPEGGDGRARSGCRAGAHRPGGRVGGRAGNEDEAPRVGPGQRRGQDRRTPGEGDDPRRSGGEDRPIARGHGRGGHGDGPGIGADRQGLALPEGQRRGSGGAVRASAAAREVGAQRSVEGAAGPRQGAPRGLGGYEIFHRLPADGLGGDGAVLHGEDRPAIFTPHDGDRRRGRATVTGPDDGKEARRRHRRRDLAARPAHLADLERQIEDADRRLGRGGASGQEDRNQGEAHAPAPPGGRCDPAILRFPQGEGAGRTDGAPDARRGVRHADRR